MPPKTKTPDPEAAAAAEAPAAVVRVRAKFVNRQANDTAHVRLEAVQDSDENTRTFDAEPWGVFRFGALASDVARQFNENDEFIVTFKRVGGLVPEPEAEDDDSDQG